MIKRRIKIILALLISLNLGACSLDKAHDKENYKKENPILETGNQVLEPGQIIEIGYKDIRLSPLDAFTIYTQEALNTKVKKISLESRDEFYIYKVEGYNNENVYKLEIDPMDGEILEEEVEKSSSNNKSINKKDLENVPELVEKILVEVGGSELLNGWIVDFNQEKLILEVYVKNQENVEYKYDLESQRRIWPDT